MTLWAEVRRCGIVKVGIAYLAFAWLAIHGPRASRGHSRVRVAARLDLPKESCCYRHSLFGTPP
jgi:hypothetical protein